MHDENIDAGFLRDLSATLGFLRDGADRGDDARVFDFLDALGDEFFFDRLLVNFLQQGGDFVFVLGQHFGQHGIGIVITHLHALEIEHGESAELTHGDGEARIDHAVHRAGQDGQSEFERTAVRLGNLPGDVDLVGVDGYCSRHERDFVKTIRDPCLAIASDPHAHKATIHPKFLGPVQ